MQSTVVVKPDSEIKLGGTTAVDDLEPAWETSVEMETGYCNTNKSSRAV